MLYSSCLSHALTRCSQVPRGRSDGSRSMCIMRTAPWHFRQWDDETSPRRWPRGLDVYPLHSACALLCLTYACSENAGGSCSDCEANRAFAIPALPHATLAYTGALLSMRRSRSVLYLFRETHSIFSSCRSRPTLALQIAPAHPGLPTESDL